MFGSHHVRPRHADTRPYLAGLRALNLFGNNLGALPAGLVAATQVPAEFSLNWTTWYHQLLAAHTTHTPSPHSVQLVPVVWWLLSWLLCCLQLIALDLLLNLGLVESLSDADVAMLTHPTAPRSLNFTRLPQLHGASAPATAGWHNPGRGPARPGAAAAGVPAAGAAWRGSAAWQLMPPPESQLN